MRYTQYYLQVLAALTGVLLRRVSNLHASSSIQFCATRRPILQTEWRSCHLPEEPDDGATKTWGYGHQSQFRPQYTVMRPYPRMQYWTDRGIARAEILNSPMFAPAHAAFYTLDSYEHPGLDSIPAELKRQFGNIDVFHFQNIEGLTSGFFRQVRVAFPHARILISAHNYNLVCPQVNLWFREHRVCDGYQDGRACVNCLLIEDRSHFEFRARQIKSVLDRSACAGPAGAPERSK